QRGRPCATYGDRPRSHPTSAGGAARHGRARRADRRARGPTCNHARSALQDTAYRSWSLASRTGTAGSPNAGEEDVMTPSRRLDSVALLGIDGTDVGCDVCFDLIDRYVEAEQAGLDV